MKVVILAGGFGTRIAEETHLKPKPMIEIGGKPILWHIMQSYTAYGHRAFVVALGYRAEMIRQYFLDYRTATRDLTVRLGDGSITIHGTSNDDWTVDLIDTGLETQTGGRIKRLKNYIGNEPFFLTYGDGVSDVNFNQLLEFHRAHGKLATVTAVRPPARFGGLDLDGQRVRAFTEKPQIGEGWINGGFFVLQPEALDYISGDGTFWEHEPLENMAAAGELHAYRHEGFWQCMDTMRDLKLLESLWTTGAAPWRTAR